jgi:hypothetical protein
LCNRTPEGVGLHVVREAAPAVDLDDRKPLPVFRLERGVTGDVDLVQLEAELLPELGDHAAGALTEVAARGVVERDGGYG